MYYLSALSTFSLNDNAKIRWFYLAMMPNKTCHEKWCQMMRNDAFWLHHFAIDCKGAFKKPPDFLSINEFFSKITPSLFTIKEGSTSFPKPLFSWRRLAALGNMKANFHCAHLHNLSPQGTGDVPTALSIVFTTPSVPLVGDRNGAQTATLYGWRTIRGLRQQSCGFLCGDEPALRRPLDMNYPHNYNMLVIYQIIDTIWG